MSPRRLHSFCVNGIGKMRSSRKPSTRTALAGLVVGLKSMKSRLHLEKTLDGWPARRDVVALQFNRSERGPTVPSGRMLGVVAALAWTIGLFGKAAARRGRAAALMPKPVES